MPSRGLFLFLALLATITRSATTLDLEADIPHVSKCNFCELCDGKPGLAHRRLLPVEDGGIHRPNGGGQREYAGFPRSNGEGQREPHQLTDEQLDMMLSEMKGSGHVDAQELELHEHEWDSWAAVTQAANGAFTRSPFTREADSSLFTNPLHARNKLRLSKFHAAIPRLLRLVAVDPLDFIHLHRNGYFKAGKPSSTTASRTLNSQDSSRTSSQTDTSTSSQMDTGISSQTDTSTSSQMDADFMEDEDFSVCSADEYKSSPDHILFEVSVQYPWRDLAISAPRVQFEVAPSTPSSLKATACNMFKTLLSAQFPTTLTN
eukprot:gene22497-29623_t